MRPSTLSGLVSLAILIGPGWSCGGGGGSSGGGGGSGPTPTTPDSFEPNDICPESRRILLPFSNQSLTIHNPATDDYYRVTLEAADTLTAIISFSNATGNLDLELWDTGCSARIASSATASNSEQIVQALSPGDYLIRVFTSGPDPNAYQMDASTTGGAGGLLPDGLEPNDDTGSCTQMVLDFSDTSLSIHSAIDGDVFCFQLAAAGQVTVELRFVHNLGDIDVSLWQRSPPRLVASASSSNNDEIIYDPLTGLGIDLGSGNYFVQVESPFSDTNVYEMAVTQN